MANRNNGTLMKSGMSTKAATTSGVRHGPSVPNGGTRSAPRTHMGKGAKGSTAPIKGSDRGGVK